jgi:magnesium chelatase family protein
MVSHSRAAARLTFPARFTLIAAMNPCPCGHLGSSVHPCACTAHLVRQYLGRISGPLLDRIDIHLRVPAVPYAELGSTAVGEPSESIRVRVEAARVRQRARFRDQTGLHANAHMGSREVRRFCRQTADVAEILRTAVERLGLSARGCHRVLKLSRTIADLAGADQLEPAHVREAIQYRALDRGVPGQSTSVPA